MGKAPKRVDRRAKRRLEAAERHTLRDRRTPQEQLALLDQRGFTARKERKKLAR
jgi:hypothetical protein